MSKNKKDKLLFDTKIRKPSDWYNSGCETGRVSLLYISMAKKPKHLGEESRLERKLPSEVKNLTEVKTKE